MATFLSILIILVCVLLTLIVLIQNPKGGGIASNFMSTSQIVGAKQQVEIVEQITWGFVAGLVVLCIAFAAIVGSGSGVVEAKESIVKQTSSVPTAAPATSPMQQPTAPAQTQTIPSADSSK
jgi:preprotein translocase subunit SecG